VKGRAVLVKGMVGFVAPFQGNHVAGQLRDQVRVPDDDVAPELHGAPVAGDQLMDLAQEVQVDAAGALLPDDRLAARARLPDIPGFVAANVELAAAEVRQ